MNTSHHLVAGTARRAALTLAAALLVACAASAARAASYGLIDITVEPVSFYEPVHGYVEIPVTVTNRTDTEHTIELRAPHSSYAHGVSLREVSREVVVGAGATVRVSLLQPPLEMYGSDIGVSIDGRAQNRPLDFSRFDHMNTASHHYGGYHGSRDGHALVSPGLRSTHLDHLRSRSQWLAHSERPVGTWSGRWLAYSSYDAVFVSGQEMTSMPAGPREALLRYVAAGGVLAVVGDWQLPAELAPDAVDIGGGQSIYHGFGRILLAPRPGAAVLKQVDGEIDRSDRPFQTLRDADEAHQVFPVKEDLRVPVRGLFALLLVFAIVIGPVNLIVLAKLKRRMWLLWTVPAISIAFATGVFLFNAVQEGWTGLRRVQAITVLDQRAHRASTIGWVGFYSPLTPGDGLRFDDETELTPQVHRWGNDARHRTVKWTTGQHLASGWITARVPATFQVRRSAPDRQRVEFTRSGATWTATNGLEGLAIERLVFAAPDGSLHAAEDIAPGAKAKLNALGRSASRAPTDDRLRRVFASDWMTNAMPTVLGSPEKLLAPGDYVALVPDTPFIDPGLADADRQPATSLIYGAHAVELK